MKQEKSSNGIAYKILGPDDVDEMASLLADVFSRHDPLAVAIGLPRAEIEGLIRLSGVTAVSDGLTVVARAGSGELVGAMFAGDFVAPPPAAISEVAPGFAPIGDILGGLDEQYRRTHEIRPGSHLHLFMLGVLPAYGGRGIAQSMVRLCLDNGHRRGFSAAVTEATGRVSRGIFRKFGFNELQVAPYRTFTHAGRQVFASIEAQEGTVLMEKVNLQ